MFWGLIMEPNKRYTQTVERPFHVSQATLDISTADGTAVQVMLCFENRNYLLCNLNKDQTSQVPLDLNFQEGTKIAFTSNGRGHVHLTGYLIPEDDELDMDELEDEDDMDEEEAPQLVGKSTKRKADELLSAATLKKMKAVLNQSASEEGEDSSDDDDEDDDDEADPEADDSDDDAEEEEEEENVEEEEDDEEEDEEEEEEEDDSEEEEEEKVEQKPKGKQNQNQQKNNKQEAKAVVNGKDGKQQKKNQKEQQPQQQNKKDQQNYKESQQTDKQQQNKKDKQNEQQQVQKKRVLSGGVQIEELTVGTGQPAKNGKFVSVYYVGKLKNGKKFDSVNKGEGFRFRLGAKEVIKGWDIGVAGMKVGGKRRITVPAAMGYGQKGSPPVIPPNSLLVFDVELKKVN